MSIKKGDTVSWTSHGRGSSVQRVGIVEAVIPAGQLPSAEHSKAVKSNYLPRDRESYIVHVSAGPESRSKGKLYWPHASLTKI